MIDVVVFVLTVVLVTVAELVAIIFVILTHVEFEVFTAVTTKMPFSGILCHMAPVRTDV
jgi:hypothetical protein